MLEGLKGLGLKLGIVSNTAALYQVFAVLKEYGIRDYFQDVTLSSVTGMRKPAPDIFRVAMCQLQSAPEECVYVGDPGILSSPSGPGSPRPSRSVPS